MTISYRVFDHSIADPRQSGLFVQPKPGKAANKREQSKKVKYQNELAKQGTKFSPFVLESYGRWGYRTRHIFKQIVLKVKENRLSMSVHWIIVY